MIETNRGEITLALDADKAPKTVENFLAYVDAGFYDGTVFHRVIEDFMIQGGGMTPDMSKKKTDGDPIDQRGAQRPEERPRQHRHGAHHRIPHSATAQFFINHEDNAFLDYPGRDGWGYAVFGKVTDGMDVGRRHRASDHGTGGRRRRPEGNHPDRIRYAASTRIPLQDQEPHHDHLQTTLGDIIIELNEENAPKTCENFKQYVRDGHFDGTIFHRVIDNFMIQGGGFTADMTQKPTRDPIENEAKNGLKNERGTIAMARTTDPHSATAQFFINVKDNGFLDHPGQDGWGYCVFGKVARGYGRGRSRSARSRPPAGAGITMSRSSRS